MSYLDLKWPQHAVNYVGVTFPIDVSKDEFKLFQLGLDSYCDKLAPTLNLRKTRSLTLLGKITTLKSLILPKLYYKLSMMLIEIHQHL